MSTDQAPGTGSSHAIRAAADRFGAPVAIRSTFQLANAFCLFVAGCAALYLVYPISYPLTLVLAVPVGALLVRIFIIQHDCGHGSFFASRRLNSVVGTLCGVLTLTPYANWRRQHAAHHGNWNNLDRRLSGSDIYSSCVTVTEYRALSSGRRLLLRVLHHPVVANLVLPPFVFILLYRLPFDTPRSWPRERRSVYWTNLAIVTVAVALSLGLGFQRVILVQLPVMVVASVIGVWLFAVQHRFEGALWARHDDWDFATASLHGSSYLRLPRPLQWLSGNIGFHHVHHLAPRIPNYRLEACHEAVPALRAVPACTIGTTLRAMRLALWDEDGRRFVTFADARGSRAATERQGRERRP